MGMTDIKPKPARIAPFSKTKVSDAKIYPNNRMSAKKLAQFKIAPKMPKNAKSVRRGMPVSGRSWKLVEAKRSSGCITKTKNQKNAWLKRKNQQKKLKHWRKYRQSIKDAKEEEYLRKRKQKREFKEQQRKKNMVVQKITNTKK